MQGDTPKEPRKGIPFEDKDKPKYKNEDHRLAEEQPTEYRIIEEFGKKLRITNNQFYYAWPLLNRAERKAAFDDIKKKGVRKTHIKIKEIRNGEMVNVTYLTNKVGKPQI